MTALKYSDIAPAKIGEGAERRVAHTDNLMIVVVDFFDGPKSQPDPPHSRPERRHCLSEYGCGSPSEGDKQPMSHTLLIQRLAGPWPP